MTASTPQTQCGDRDWPLDDCDGLLYNRDEPSPNRGGPPHNRDTWRQPDEDAHAAASSFFLGPAFAGSRQSATYLVRRDEHGTHEHLLLSDDHETIMCRLLDEQNTAAGPDTPLSTYHPEDGSEMALLRSRMARPHIFVRDDNGVMHDLFLDRFQEFALLEPHIPEQREMSPEATIREEDVQRALQMLNVAEDLERLRRAMRRRVVPSWRQRIRARIMAKFRKPKRKPRRMPDQLARLYRDYQIGPDSESDVSWDQATASMENVRRSPREQTRLRKAGRAIAKSAKAIVKFPVRVLKTKKEPSPRPDQDNLIVYTTQESRYSRLVHTSRVFGRIANLNPFRSRPGVPDNRNWVAPTPMIPEDRSAHVEEWVATHAAFVDPENRVVALTSAEFDRFNAASSDWYQFLKPGYQGPHPSPAPSEAGDEPALDDLDTRAHAEVGDETTLNDLEAESADGSELNAKGSETKGRDTPSASGTAANNAQPGRLSIDSAAAAAAALRLADEQYDRDHQIRDLRDIVPPYTGFYVISPNVNESMLEVGDNYSDYYGMPLIDPRPKSRFRIVIDDDDESEEFDRDIVYNLHTPKSQPAAQAIMQYLIFKGLPIDEVATALSRLDADFLYTSPSRWWKRHRFPELWELNDEVVAIALDVCKAEEQWWEGNLDRLGRPIPPALRILQSRVRARQVINLARKSIESYLWWRLRGRLVNLEIPRGPNMIENVSDDE